MDSVAYSTGFIIGAALGLYFFCGLWLTVRHVPFSAKPVRLLTISFLIRLVPTLTAMLFIARWNPEARRQRRPDRRSLQLRADPGSLDELLMSARQIVRRSRMRPAATSIAAIYTPEQGEEPISSVQAVSDAL